MNFQDALSNLKDGKRVARSGWNGKGQWIAAQYPDDHSKMTLPYVYINTVHGSLVPWICSQGDMFADDWELVAN